MSKKITTQLPVKKANGISIKTKLCNAGNYTKQSSLDVSYIVMHYTGNTADCALNNAAYYNRTSTVGASAHLFVDEKEIYLSVPLNCKAWHVGNDTYVHKLCRNSNSIGIEMCTSGNYLISSKTIENAAYLCAELCKYVGITADKVDTYVLRHYDVTHKLCPRQMSGENNAEWKAFKGYVKDILNGKSITVKEIKPTLREGDSGYYVEEFQKGLAKLGYKGKDGKVIDPDGAFGANTKYAVQAFQKACGSKTCDGIVGEWTWAKLEEALVEYKAPTKYCAPSLPSLRQGDAGTAVLAMKTLLLAHDKKCGVVLNEKFDAKTTEALNRFQDEVFGKHDGICGKNSWEMLCGGDIRDWDIN